MAGLRPYGVKITKEPGALVYTGSGLLGGILVKVEITPDTLGCVCKIHDLLFMKECEHRLTKTAPGQYLGEALNINSTKDAQYLNLNLSGIAGGDGDRL